MIFRKNMLKNGLEELINIKITKLKYLILPEEIL